MRRREFTRKLLLAGGTAAVLGGGLTIKAQPRRSRVIMAQSPRLIRQNHATDPSSAREMVAKAMLRMTGKNSARNAWASIFSVSERVAIKVSCLPGLPLSSSPGVVGAVIAGLLDAGLHHGNIIIWERTRRELERAGFHTETRGVRILGTDELGNGGYSDKVEISGSVGTCFSRVLESVDAIINIPVLKDHDIAGVSIGMKNFFGAIYNPNKFHDNGCDPYVADLCRHPLIRKKLRLTICDASRIQIHNGPAYFPRYAMDTGMIIISTDPVALDFIGWQLIEEERAKKGLPPLRVERREPSYIRSAARIGLGTDRTSHIERIHI